MSTVVFGGTGKVGSAAVKRLVEAGRKVSVYTRHPQKVAAIAMQAKATLGDLDASGDLVQMLSDADSVILITQVNPREEARGRAVVAAAARAGVKHFVFLSLVQGEWSDSIPFYKSKLAIEADLRASGMKWAIVRSAGFMQTDAGLKSDIWDKGLFTAPIGDVGINRIDTRDVGYAIAEANLTGAEGDFRIFGPETLTGANVAEIYTQVLGKAVTYAGNDLERWAEMKKDAFPPWSLNALRSMYAYSQRVGMKPEPGERRSILMPPAPRTFAEFAAEVNAAWKS